MYRYFAVVGAPISIAAILATALLTFLSRSDRASFRWSLAATILLVLWLASWFAIVAPANNQIAAMLATDPARVPDLWLRLRPRWEGGHALGFALELGGFAALSISVLTGKRNPPG